jgi:hypothetical protein
MKEWISRVPISGKTALHRDDFGSHLDNLSHPVNMVQVVDEKHYSLARDPHAYVNKQDKNAGQV